MGQFSANPLFPFPTAGAAVFDPVSADAEIRSLRLPAAEDSAGEGAAATVGASVSMQRLRSQILRIAPYFRTALVMGPVGTGKEGVARMLHASSPATPRAFAAYDATAMAEALMRGDGLGLLEPLGASSPGGTLFLDEIGEVPAALQGMLLRIWSTPMQGRIRVVAGTHRDLRTMVVTGQMRPNLLERLGGVELAIAPLRERREDLAEVIGEVLRSAGGGRALVLSDDAMACLKEHGWPGDLAEVEQVLWAAAQKAGESLIISPEHLPALRCAETTEQDEIGLDRLEDVVRQHVLTVLTRCGGNKVRAAEVLGISRSTLYRMLESHNGSGFVNY